MIDMNAATQRTLGDLNLYTLDQIDRIANKYADESERTGDEYYWTVAQELWANLDARRAA